MACMEAVFRLSQYKILTMKFTFIGRTKLPKIKQRYSYTEFPIRHSCIIIFLFSEKGC